MPEFVTEQDLARARGDAVFRQQLMIGSLERLPEALKQKLKAEDPSPESARQLVPTFRDHALSLAFFGLIRL
jgi:hypothetical protein